MLRRWPTAPLPEFATAVSRLEGHRGRRLPGWLARRRAAVAVVLRPGPDGSAVEVLLVGRAVRSGDPWSGDMAFPGGLAAHQDGSLRATAVRETREEVGLDLGRGGRLVTALSERLTLSPDRKPLVVRPLVFTIEREGSEPDPAHRTAEIESSHWIDLAFFERPAHHTTLSRRYLGIPMTFACYRHEGRPIWGLTLRMVRELLRAAS